ncbi:homoserine dehydrogenase [Pullulanibacillus pueri]|uniref:Homoserine dehydrogenase n=1 Tax=Pullulanibacillus pueri TaxID=1437324 RepID=A0A8J2ZSK7_9BACL|nr:homoserine dehydrogenase [Pullulanibacillus pueri]MBM7680408.1 homoserine dehydrogenase [Pullulanibacillus pueri]GGH75223.1 hypothetical protein GCM10007096_04230 [Pullulanibacillus pueri]
MTLNVALIGFGTVGSAVYRLIHTRREAFKKLIGQEIRITDIVIKDKNKKREIDSFTRITTQIDQVLSNPEIDVVIEAIVGVEPAFSYLSKALEKGLPVITANKVLFAQKGDLLKKLAGKNATTVGYEATVAGGIPIMRTLIDLLHVNRISKVEGVLNGTANFILSDMRTESHSFEEALALAQSLGYAEADPSNDILGTDAFYKLMILCQTIFGQTPAWSEVPVTGIHSISAVDIEVEALRGNRYKLIAEATLNDDGEVEASVKPQLIDNEHPLYGVEGVDNAVTLHTDLLGTLTLKGPGAGGNATASAVFSDLVKCTEFLSISKVKAPV